MKRRNFLPLVTLPLVSAYSWAQKYPSSPSTIIMPLQAGSASDVAIRHMAERLTQKFGLELDRVLVRLVGVSLDSLVENDDVTQMVLGERTSSWQQADRAIDRVKAKFGRSSLRPARLVDDKDED